MQPGALGRIASTVFAIAAIAFLTWLKNQPSAPSSAPSFSEISNGHYDLGRDEQLGGHTLERHINRSDEQLMERLEREPDISAASTYRDRAAAEQTVASALTAQRDRLESWLNRPDYHPNLSLQYHGRDPIGRCIRRGGRTPELCYDAVVVLRWDGDHRFHVLTTYPEEPRRGQ